jgi:hypothetical protein
VTAIDCPHGVAPERMPKADATGLAPKKSADHNPPVHDSSVQEGVASTSAPRCFYIQALRTLSRAKSKSSPISLVKSLSGGLGPKTRRPPGRLCRAFRIPFFCSSAVGIPLLPTQARILSHSRAPSTPPASQTEKEYEKAAQTKSDDFGENERDALHQRCEADSITLKNCPAYIRRWITGERR